MSISIIIIIKYYYILLVSIRIDRWIDISKQCGESNEAVTSGIDNVVATSNHKLYCTLTDSSLAL